MEGQQSSNADEAAEAMQNFGAQLIVTMDLVTAMAAESWPPEKVAVWEQMCRENMQDVAKDGWDMTRELRHIDLFGAKIRSFMKAFGKIEA